MVIIQSNLQIQENPTNLAPIIIELYIKGYRSIKTKAIKFTLIKALRGLTLWIVLYIPDVWVEHRQTHDIQGCANASRSNDQKQRDQLQQKMLPMTYCNATKLHYCITFLVTTMTNKRTSSNVLSRCLWPSKTLTQAPCVLGLERSVAGVWRGCGLRNRITDSNKDREQLLLPLQPPVHRSSTFLRTQYLPLHNSPRHVHPPVVTYEKGSEG